MRQNNLGELLTLLILIVPDLIREVSEQESIERLFYGQVKDLELLSSERITRAKQMIAPFILQRSKQDVLQVYSFPQSFRICQSKCVG